MPTRFVEVDANTKAFLHEVTVGEDQASCITPRGALVCTCGFYVLQWHRPDATCWCLVPGGRLH